MDQNTQKDDKKKIEILEKKCSEAEQKNNLLQEELQKKDLELEEVKNYAESLMETSKRALADLANFRRRSEEEKKHFIQFANAVLIQEMLQITDIFERAFNHIPEELEKNDWVEGISQIEKKFKGILAKQGVREIDAIGKKMNTEEHEAIITCSGEKDLVIEVLEKGYIMGDKVLRPAKVKVGDGANQKTSDKINDQVNQETVNQTPQGAENQINQETNGKTDDQTNETETTI
ncbi:nucleotide exchange factor GrpE [Candidatus Peregrinibacteria bacterium]|nr:nucleotide exchange factor GrpE [Candidatus Peregrinibacteria bacterium]